MTNKTSFKAVAWIALFCLVIGSFAACAPQNPNPTDNGTEPPKVETVDYVDQLKLDMNSDSLKQEVTVKSFVDGDTTHFNVPKDLNGTDVFKARYLAVNTPESTGKIEEYGKKASNFTREKLSTATSIIIESDNNSWNADSTGSRYLVWVWYKPSESGDYRNLNLEILQNGLAIASNSGNNRYGDVCMKALEQAKAQKLNVHSGEKDPEFYYGGAEELTLKELKTNIEAYKGKKVAFNGIVTMNYNNGVYVESLDPETNRSYGIYVFYGFNLSGKGMEILSVGNEVRIVGSCQYWEGGGSYQISDVSYRQMKPDDPGNIQKLSDGHKAPFQLTDPKTFAESSVEVETSDGTKTFQYAELAMGTSVEMKNLKVKDIFTTSKEDSKNKGAMTLTCESEDGTKIVIRTAVLLDADGNLITADAYKDKTIDVKGIVDSFDGEHQIKVFSEEYITVH